MQFLTIASAIFATALAAPTAQAPDPSTYENINISDYTLRKNNGIQMVSFKLTGNNVTDVSCEIGPVSKLPSEVVTCGDSQYRFGLIDPPIENTDVGLRLYHQTSPFAGKTGEGAVATYCHAGGNGANDFVCQQTAGTTIVIN